MTRNLQISYTTFKAIVDGMKFYYVVASRTDEGDPNAFLVFLGTELYEFQCNIDANADVDDFTSELIDQGVEVNTLSDATALSAKHLGLLESLRTDNKLPRVAFEKAIKPHPTFISHDWCKKTTWFATATRVVDEVAADSGDHLTYSLAHQFVIDTYHGQLSDEETLVDSGGHSYRVVVKVNGAAVDEQDPHLGSGGDFTVDYAAGTISFLAALEPGDVVTVTYHYAVDSTFIVRPEAGKTLVINSAEVQFASDVVLKDTAVFQPYGLVDVFAPQLVAGGFVPTGTKIPLGAPKKYKTMLDYYNDAKRAYPELPALGGSSWRGVQHKSVVLDWDYEGAIFLSSAAGMEVRIFLEHHEPFEGSFATATLYGTTEPEE